MLKKVIHTSYFSKLRYTVPLICSLRMCPYRKCPLLSCTTAAKENHLQKDSDHRNLHIIHTRTNSTSRIAANRSEGRSPCLYFLPYNVCSWIESKGSASKRLRANVVTKKDISLMFRKRRDITELKRAVSKCQYTYTC